MTKLERLGEIWSKLNTFEMETGEALEEIKKLYPRGIMKAWRKYCDESHQQDVHQNIRRTENEM